jgi:TP901 family phage tail tape measure protein
MAGTTVSLKLLIAATNTASKQIRTLQSQINKVSEEAKKLGAESAKASAQGKKGLDKFSESAEKFKRKMDAAKEATKGLGAAGATLVGIAASLGTAVFFPVRQSVEFERSLAKVVAVTANAQQKFEELKNTASELGRTTEFTARQAAEGMVFLGMAGLEASEVIAGIAPALELAIAANVEVAQAADIATNILAAMRLPVEELTTATDILASTTANSNTNLLELADAMKYAGPLAAAAGVSLEETSAILGALANNGIKASMAGTAVRGMLRALTAPSERGREVLDRLGISIQLNADGSLNLVEALEQLGRAQINSADATKLFGRFAAAGALAVTANIKGLKELIVVNEASAGAAARMAQIMKDNVKGSFIEMTSAIDGTVRALSEPLLGAIREVIRAVTEMAGWVTYLAEQFPILTKVIGLATIALTVFAATAGVAALAISGVVGTMGVLANVGVTPALKNFAKGMTSVSAVGGKLTGVIKKIGAALKWLTTTVGGFLLILGGLIIAWGEWANRTEGMIRVQQRLIATVSKVSKSFSNQLAKLQELEEGSEKYVAVSKNMRVELLKIAENTEKLAPQALAAAYSINEFTGEVTQGSTALEEFAIAAQKVEIEATAEQVDLLVKRFKELTGQSDLLTTSWLGWSLAIRRVLATIIPGGKDSTEVLEDHERAIKAVMEQTKLAAKSYVRLNEAFGELDPESSEAAVKFFFDEIQKHASDTSEIYTNTFMNMRREAEKTADTQKKVEELSLEQLKGELETASEKLADLDGQWKAARRSAEEAIAVFNQVGGEAALKAAEESYKKQAELQVERTKQFEEAEGIIRGLKKKSLADDKKWYDDQLKALTRQKNLEYIIEAQFIIEKAKLDADYAKKRQKSIEDLVGAGLAISIKESEVVADLTQDKVDADKRVVKSGEDLTDARIKLANQQRSAIRQINKRAKAEELSLEVDSIAKFWKLQEAEIEVLKETAKEKLIQEEKLNFAISVIRRKYDKIIKDWQDEQRDEEEKATLALNKVNAENKIAELERSFKAGKISAAQYSAEVLEIQKEAIDDEIKYLNEQLEKARKENKAKPVLIEIETKIKKAEGERVEIDAGAVDAARQLELQKQRQKLSLEAELLRQEQANMVERTDGLEAMAVKELEIYKNTLDQKLIAFEASGASELQIANMTAQQQVAITQKTSELEKAILTQKLQYAQQIFTDMGQVFGDLYALSGEKTRAWFYLEKAAAIARIIISTQLAAMKAYEQMGIYGTVGAAMIYAAGATSIARVVAQGFAKGGEVLGRSPNKKADNIPAWLTAEEWVHPVDTVKYYGKKVMEGMQQKIFPREIFYNYKLPVPVPAYGRGYAFGGEVKKESVRERKTMGRTKTDPIPAQPTPITIVNVNDPAQMDQYLASSGGQNAILNVLSTRSETIKRILK